MSYSASFDLFIVEQRFGRHPTEAQLATLTPETAANYRCAVAGRARQEADNAAYSAQLRQQDSIRYHSSDEYRFRCGY